MINKAILLGRVGRDPEFRRLQSGGMVANFSLATSETWRDRNGERQERTQWHNIVVWNEGLVKVIENYVRKGDLLYVEGQIETRKWQDQSGSDRYTTEIVLKAFGGTIKLMPKGARQDGDGRRDDDRDRNSYRDRREGRTNGSGGGRSGYMDDDDAIPF